jgi:hypothetical protein
MSPSVAKSPSLRFTSLCCVVGRVRLPACSPACLERSPPVAGDVAHGSPQHDQSRVVDHEPSVRRGELPSMTGVAPTLTVSRDL